MGKRILIIDDDVDIINIYQACFKGTEFTVDSAGNGFEGLKKYTEFKPNLIILDIMMPEVNGFEFCVALRKQEGEIPVPVIFASAEQDNDRPKAFSYGAVDYLVKPFRKADLFESINKNIGTGAKWEKFLDDARALGPAGGGTKYKSFIEKFAAAIEAAPEAKGLISAAGPRELYSVCEGLKIGSYRVAQQLAEYYAMPYMPFIDPESIIMGFLPVSFLQNNKVVAVKDMSGKPCFVVAEPFNEGLMDLLKNYAGYPFAVTEPKNIDLLFDNDMTDHGMEIGQFMIEMPSEQKAPPNKWESAGIMKLSNILIAKAIMQGEKGISVEIRNPAAYIKLGQQRPAQVMAKTGIALILRYKILAGLDIVDNQNAQNGDIKIDFLGNKYTVKVAAVPNPTGESCVLSISGPK